MYGGAINLRPEYYEGPGRSAPRGFRTSSLEEPEDGWELHILA